MKKIFLAIPLSLLVFSTSFAFSPLFPKLMMDKIKASKAGIKKIKNTHEHYADFSGQWLGTCDDNPDEENRMSIEQSEDASSLIINNAEFPIDAIVNDGFQANFVSVNAMLHIHWNKDGQQLMWSGVSYFKVGNMSQDGLSDGLNVGIIKSAWSIENQQLIVENRVSVYVDGTLLLSDRGSRCVYKKA